MEKLKLFFELVNKKAFCERYGISYDYLRHVMKGKYELSEKFKIELDTAIDRYKKELQEIT